MRNTMEKKEHEKFWKILSVALAGIVFFFLWIVIKVDVSFTPLSPNTSPDAFDNTYKKRPFTVLVSYADGDPVFFQNQYALNASAVNRGFDAIHAYRRSHIDEVFYHQNIEILKQSRGAGYWLWKPYFILKTMEMYPEDAVIVYADSGVIFSESLEKIFSHLKNHDRIFVKLGNTSPLRKHIKKEAQTHLGISCNEDVLGKENIWGFFMVFKNTTENRQLVKKWLTLCERKELLADEPLNSAIQDPSFLAHQHDQSLLTAILNMESDRVYQKTLLIRKNVLRFEYGVINFHRHPGENKKSGFFLIAGIPRWLNSVVFNNPIMELLRCFNSFVASP